MTQPFPLSGFRVIDYSHFLAGPYLRRCLARMGAEVIEVERPKLWDAGRQHACGQRAKRLFYPTEYGQTRALCQFEGPARFESDAQTDRYSRCLH